MEGVAAQVSISAFDFFAMSYALFLGATTQQIGLLAAVPNLLSSLSLLFAVRADPPIRPPRKDFHKSST